VFVGAQVAFAVTLLLTATLFARSLQKGLATDIGFEPDGVVVATINLGPPLDYDRERGQAFQRALRERMRALPGIEGVAHSQYVLLSGSRSSGRYWPADAPDDASVRAAYSSITPAYFETMRIRMVAGRAFTDADADDAAPVVIINQTLADRLWPDQNAVGRMLLGPIGATPAEVIGVTSAGRYTFITEELAAYVFYPYNQVYRPQMAIHVRAPGAEAATLRALVDEVRILDPDVALGMPSRLEELVDASLLPHRWAALFVGGLGVAGLVLAALGIYGVLACEVTGRTREFGVRRALGATRARVIGSVVRRGALLAGIGCTAGAALGAGVGVGMQSLLFGIRPLDAVTFTAVPTVLFGVALLASWLPASRASDVEPSEALRSE
jgi:predicted permease